ncbi:MAG: extracellular solute-binding protein, partial [Clostridiales bacterium]|nr:extracellular solute-binding protein [Clostridiales bacterium]
MGKEHAKNGARQAAEAGWADWARWAGAAKPAGAAIGAPAGANRRRKAKMRRAAAALCAAALALAISACGSGGANTAQPAGTEAPATTAAAAGQAQGTSAAEQAGGAEAESSQAAEATQEAAAASQEAPADAGAGADADAGEPYKFAFFNNIFSTFSAGDQAFFDRLMAETNTEIELQNMPSSSYEESLTVMMAGGDYPELVMFPDYTKPVFLDGVKYQAVLPLNDYIANAPNVQKYTYPVSFKVLSVMGDGQIYGIPRTSVARADGYMVRQDWLDRLGISLAEGEPLTLEAFTAMLR